MLMLLLLWSFAGTSFAEEGLISDADLQGLDVYAYVCRDSAGEIRDVLTFDLAEAGVSATWDQKGDADPIADEMIDRSLHRLRKAGLEFADGALWLKIKALESRWTPTLPENRTAEQNEAFKRAAERPPSSWLRSEGCKLEPMVVFHAATQKFWVRDELYQRLAPLHRAGARLHIAAYGNEIQRIEPYRREPNTDLARGFVRTLLQGETGVAASGEDLNEAINFREPHVSDEAASFARWISRFAVNPLPCAKRACEVREFAGLYLLLERRGEAKCEAAMGIYMDEKRNAIGVGYNIAQEELHTEAARNWPAFPGLTRLYGGRLAGARDSFV